LSADTTLFSTVPPPLFDCPSDLANREAAQNPNQRSVRMQRLKRVGVASLAVFALSAVASASASAGACHKEAGSKEWTLCVEGEEIGSATETGVVPFRTHIKEGTHSTLGLGGKEQYSEKNLPLVNCTKVK
jgi:hypothetical protein